MNFNTEKSTLRELFRKKRSSLTSSEVLQKSQKVSHNFLQNLLPKISPHLSEIFTLYLSSGNEVSTAAIAEFFQKNQIIFSYPKIIDKDMPLEFIRFSETQKFQPSKFYRQILEPASGEKVTPNFLIMPLLAFDSRLYRLGMGGGFYDRTIYALQQQKVNFITIGLAYENQCFEGNLPNTKWDCRLDFIVTEEKVYHI